MATAQLKANLISRLKARGATVQYQKFVESSGNINQGTKEVISEAAAYPASIELIVLIDYQPSQATRQKLGLQGDVAAVLTILTSECEEKSVVVTGKDRFILGDNALPYYVAKEPTRMQQSGDEFLTLMVALIRKTGGKRNR